MKSNITQSLSLGLIAQSRAKRLTERKKKIKTHFNYPSFSLLPLIPFLQTFPVAASSLCLLMLSLDRYATVKHSRFTHLRQRHYVPSVLAIASWLGSFILCLPFLFAYTATQQPSTHQFNSTSPFVTHNDSLINGRKLCQSNYGFDEWHLIFIISYVSVAFIAPCLGIIFNHLGELLFWKKI